MSGGRICHCDLCTETCPSGKEVSVSTYYRHRGRRYEPSSDATIANWPCTACENFPEGHYMTKSMFFKHTRELRQARARVARGLDTSENQASGSTTGPEARSPLSAFETGVYDDDDDERWCETTSDCGDGTPGEEELYTVSDEEGQSTSR